MSYYSDVSKKQRADNLLAIAKKGAPESACFIPGTAIAYCFNQPQRLGYTIYLHRWTSGGKHIMTTRPVIEDSFEYQGVTYHVHWESLTVHTHPAIILDQKYCDEHTMRACRWLDCKSVPVERNAAALKDNIETSRQAYHRRQMQRMLLELPEGYHPLPGTKTSAYRVYGDAVRVIKPTAPQTVAKGGPKFKESKHPIYGTAIIAGQAYRLAPCGTRLYRDGHTEDVFGAGDDTNEQRITFEEMRPRDKPVVPGELAWYEIVLGKTPKVRFGFIKGRKVVHQTAEIMSSLVKFNEKFFRVDPFGNLSAL